jgi:hypothetical protein
MHKLLNGAAMVALLTTPLAAQPVAAPIEAAAVQAPAVAADGTLTLNAGIPVTLAVSQEVNSSKNHQGDPVPLTVLNDVKIGDTIVIPRGTPAVGEVTWRTGKGAFGKSGKLEFVLHHIDLNGQRIPIAGEYRQEGEGNTIATGVAIIAVGVFAGFITGKRARLPMGRELMARIAEPVQFTADGRLSPSYDSAAAMASADGKTQLGQCRAAAAGNEKAMKKCFKERME